MLLLLVGKLVHCRHSRQYVVVIVTTDAVPDPDLEIRGVGRGGGGRSPPKIFSALLASVWSKNKG